MKILVRKLVKRLHFANCGHTQQVLHLYFLQSWARTEPSSLGVKMFVHVRSKLPSLAPFQSEWKYNNWLYALVAQIIETRSADLWQSPIHQILEALGMNRYLTTNPNDENVAHGYKVFNDGRMSEDGLPLLKGGDAFDGSGSLRSCVNDMIIWCKVLIQATRTEPSIKLPTKCRLIRNQIISWLDKRTYPQSLADSYPASISSISSGQGLTTSLRPRSLLLPTAKIRDQHRHQQSRT